MKTVKTHEDCQRPLKSRYHGKFVDRCKHICAAGKPTVQADLDIRSNFQQYQLQDEVDALLGDAIIPPPPPRKLAPFRTHVSATNSLKELVNPPEQTKFREIIDELKSTGYSSYWKSPLAEAPDNRHMFPNDFDIKNTTFGKKNPVQSLYDLITPKVPLVETSQELPAQTRRNYCPPFNPDLTYGYRTGAKRRDCYVEKCLTDHKVQEGTEKLCAINSIDAEMRSKHSALGKAPTRNTSYNNSSESGSEYYVKVLPNLNINLDMTCPITQRFYEVRRCLGHLNYVRHVICNEFPPGFFPGLCAVMKRDNEDKTGWVPKETVYATCAKHHITFNPSRIETLLTLWEAFDGSKIKYEVFFRILNHRMRFPDLPKIPDQHPDRLDYRTTYQEMVKPGRPCDERPMAGLPSGRYIDLDYPKTPDGYCTAAISFLSDELDVKCCVCPSILTTMHVSHRDMYARREPEVVRRVFEAAGEEFTDEKFNEVWEEAKKHHSQGWVCFETFRRANEQLYPLCA